MENDLIFMKLHTLLSNFRQSLISFSHNISPNLPKHLEFRSESLVSYRPLYTGKFRTLHERTDQLTNQYLKNYVRYGGTIACY